MQLLVLVLLGVLIILPPLMGPMVSGSSSISDQVLSMLLVMHLRGVTNHVW